MLEGLHQINQVHNEDGLEEVMIEPEAGLDFTASECHTVCTSTTIPAPLADSLRSTSAGATAAIPAPLTESSRSTSAGATTPTTTPTPLAVSPLPPSTFVLPCSSNSDGSPRPAPSVFSGILQSLGSTAPSLTVIQPIVLDLPIIPHAPSLSTPGLDDYEDEETPIVTPWSSVITPSSPLIVAGSQLAEGSSAAITEPVNIILNDKHWSAFDCHGFKWLIGGTEGWGDWQACVRMLVDSRIKAGFPVRILDYIDVY